MKLGFICPNVPGHLNPITALARHLQLRNHEVVFLYSSGAAGLPFVPSYDEDQINENVPEISKMQGGGRLAIGRPCVTGTNRVPFMGGLIKQLLQLWPETARVSPDL